MKYVFALLVALTLSSFADAGCRGAGRARGSCGMSARRATTATTVERVRVVHRERAVRVRAAGICASGNCK